MRLYRALLRLLPASFRNEYGGEMYSDFGWKMRDASSAPACLLLWLETVCDLVLAAIGAHCDILLQDLRYASRSLAASPAFTVTCILVASLGVGATTIAFSLTNHVLLRPLPFADAKRLVKLWEDQSSGGYTRMEPSPANYRDWKRMSTVFEDMAAYRGLSVNLIGSGRPERLEGASVNANLFPMIGAKPFLGTLFSTADDRDGAPGTAVLSYSLWRSRFASDQNVTGRKILLDGEPYIIIGVMPPAFVFPRREVEIWTAMRFSNSDFEDRGNNYLQVLAKLRPGVSLLQARAEMRAVASQLQREYPKLNRHIGVSLAPLQEVNESSQTMLFALVGASLCVLLIACLNLANLLLARALARRKELGVRMALGAGRERLVRQLLTESLLLAISGGLLGVAFASFTVPLFARLVPDSLPIAGAPAIDIRVLAFAFLVTVTTGIGFGVLPALRACRVNAGSALQEGHRQGVGGRKERLRALLVIAEVVGSVVLLTTSGLLIRALWRVQNTDPGFHAAGVLTVRTALTNPQYAVTSRRIQFYDRVLSGVKSISGVQNAAYTSFLPIVMSGGVWAVAMEGQPADDASLRRASLRFVTPGFFATMGIPLREGRDVDVSDTNTSPYVAVVSQSFAHQFWPNQNPIGRRFQFAFATRTVVGVVGDVRVRGLELSSEPQVYLSYKQVPDEGLVWYAPKDLAIRTSMEPMLLLSAVRRVVAEADPQQPVSDVQTLEDIVETDTSPRRIQVRILGAFAFIAFLLAGVGIQGLLSFSVASRRQEIGVRLALGAQPGNILKMVLCQGVVLAAIGLGFGILLAYAAGRALESLLAGVQPGDLLTFCASAVIVLLLAIAGSFAPAMQAVRIDPISTLR
jgi:putative ABC transport system permease protein